MIVDDNPAGRLLLRAYLQRLGFRQLEEFGDSMEALRQLMLAAQVQNPFAAMFIDWTMSEMTDLQVVRTIRGLPGWNDFPIIVLSEELDESKVAAVFAAGGSEHLLRPVTEPTLRTTLKKFKLL